MSELKVIKIELNNHGKPIASIQGTTSYYGISPNDTFYPQAEADKVIAEKDKEIDLYKRGWEESDRINASIYAELRHQKYKRCLAMAEWCDAEADVADADGDYEDMRWYQQWHERWLDIAEKFKEDKQ